MAPIASLWSRRELLWYWIIREVRVRYKQSFIGVGWAILQPAALTAISTFVFSYLAKLPSDGIPYPIFAYTALVPWSFFATAVSQGVPSIVNQMNLVTKSSFPREILPLGVIGAALVDFVSAFAMLLFLLVIYQTRITITILWLPFLVCMQIILATGVVLLGATINVFLRDIRFAVPLVMQIWLYLSPIIYPISLVPERFRTYYALNPMVGLITSYRNILLKGLGPEWDQLWIGALTTLMLFFCGYLLFKKAEPSFADMI